MITSMWGIQRRGENRCLRDGIMVPSWQSLCVFMASAGLVLAFFFCVCLLMSAKFTY
jgi:hypothetical protein